MSLINQYNNIYISLLKDIERNTSDNIGESKNRYFKHLSKKIDNGTVVYFHFRKLYSNFNGNYSFFIKSVLFSIIINGIFFYKNISSNNSFKNIFESFISFFILSIIFSIAISSVKLLIGYNKYKNSKYKTYPIKEFINYLINQIEFEDDTKKRFFKQSIFN